MVAVAAQSNSPRLVTCAEHYDCAEYKYQGSSFYRVLHIIALGNDSCEGIRLAFI